MMGWNGWHMGGWGMGWGWLFGLLLLAGLVLLVVVVVRAVSGGVRQDPGTTSATNPAGSGRSRAKELLAERYARGEIDTEEYHDRLRTLEES